MEIFGQPIRIHIFVLSFCLFNHKKKDLQSTRKIIHNIPYIYIHRQNCSILGMYLFGGKFCKFMDEELGERECTCPEIISKHPLCECDRKHFNNFLWATVTVFQVSLAAVSQSLLPLAQIDSKNPPTPNTSSRSRSLINKSQ